MTSHSLLDQAQPLLDEVAACVRLSLQCCQWAVNMKSPSWSSQSLL